MRITQSRKSKRGMWAKIASMRITRSRKSKRGMWAIRKAYLIS